MAPTASTTDRASERQLEYIRDLAKKHEISEEQAAFLVKVNDGERTLSKSEASRVIDGLKARPKKKVSRDWPDIPAGGYAVVDPQDDVLKFYHVDKPTEGKWKGYTFLSVRASDERYPIKNTEHKKSIMSRIALDPRLASLRFGQEIGCCGICGRTLTDENSRARGIGPICAAKQGW